MRLRSIGIDHLGIEQLEVGRRESDLLLPGNHRHAGYERRNEGSIVR
jgi:hypothetical protein